MVCISPPELSDGQLLAYIEGESNPTITEHLAGCTHCQARTQEIARFHHQLAALLYRVACPPTLELGEYHLGLLPAAGMATVAQHLPSCPHCQAELQQLTSYLTTDKDEG